MGGSSLTRGGGGRHQEAAVQHKLEALDWTAKGIHYSFLIPTLTKYMTRVCLYLTQKNNLEQCRLSCWETLAGAYPPTDMVRYPSNAPWKIPTGRRVGTSVYW
jgi:hypothetical protein